MASIFVNIGGANNTRTFGHNDFTVVGTDDNKEVARFLATAFRFR